MTQDDRELLSRLAAGDLSPDVAASVRRRIAQDPALAEESRRLNRLTTRLGLLPDPPPPPGLDAAVLMTAAARDADASDEAELSPRGLPSGPPVMVTRARSRRSPPSLGRLLLIERLGRALPWALAAGLTLALAAAWRAEPALTLDTTGLTLTDTTLILDDLTISVEGRATLEPSGGLDRETGEEVPVHPSSNRPLDRSHLIAVAAGAAFTLAVQQGQAIVLDGGQRTVVDAGQQHAVPARAGRGVSEAEPEVDSRALADENMKLKARIAALEGQRAEVEGQLVQRGGAPVPWPAEVPPGLDADGFKALARNAASEVEGAELIEVDCTEYPCIAVYRAPHEDESVGEALGAVFEGELAAGAGLSHMAMHNDVNGTPVAVHVLAALPQGADEATRARLRVRGEEAAAQSLPTPPSPPDHPR